MSSSTTTQRVESSTSTGGPATLWVTRGRSFEIGRHEISVTASIGVASGASSEDGPQGLLQNADRAMYGAKKKGKIGTKCMTPANPRVAEAGGTSGFACASASERRRPAGREQGPILSGRDG
jgi:GGDEF domain-containing protein